MNEAKQCVGLLGRVFGHNYVPRYDQKQDYPPGIVEAMHDTLKRVTDPLQFSEAAIGKVCDGYYSLDTNETNYVCDICVRCGHRVDRFAEPGEFSERSVTTVDFK